LGEEVLGVEFILLYAFEEGAVVRLVDETAVHGSFG